MTPRPLCQDDHEGPTVSACACDAPRQVIHDVFSERSFSGGTCGAVDGADAARPLTVMDGEGLSVNGGPQRREGGGSGRHAVSAP